MAPDLADLVTRLEQSVPAMQSRAAELDGLAAFPVEDVAAIGRTGFLHAPLSREAGGLGLGTEPGGANAILNCLRWLGQGNLVLGRLMEAHVNAVRLAVRYGGPALLSAMSADASAGHLIGLWVTDPPGGGLRAAADGALQGEKQFCSGAGHVQRAVVTASDAAGHVRLAYAQLDGGKTMARPLPGSLSGMRAATTGQVAFHGAPATLFGQPDDYLREPDFSCGAWRTSAVTTGGLEALVEQVREQLTARGRDGDPHQQARFGHMLLAVETARLWSGAAAIAAEAADAGPAAIPYVGLARLAVERACFEVIELAQRSLGVAALQRSNPVERLCRDLATYLRQPAADMVLTEAAAFHLKGAA